MLKRMVWLIAVLLFGFGGYAEASVTTYSVVKNDSLRMIAKRFCGNAELFQKIADDNNISNPNMIHPRQVLTIKCEEMSNVAEAPAVADTVVITTTRVVGEQSSDVPAIDPNMPHVNTVRLVYTIPTITQQPKPAARPSTKARRRSKREVLKERASQVAHEVVQVFGAPVAAKMLEIWTGESGLRLDAVNYNCRYNGVSRSCYPWDIGKHWSVDCGIAQINWEGKECPPHLKTLRGNLLAAKRKYDNGGFRHWVVYNNGDHRPYIGMYNWVLSLSTPLARVNTIELVSMHQ